jgi:hypothetical protein
MGAERAWGKPGGRPEVRLNFHKFTTLPNERIRAARLAAALGWDINTRLCVYGCGFGWILIGFWEQGIQQIQGIENSPYIHANLALNEDAEIQAAIEAVGLMVNTGDGLTLFNAMRDDGNPRGLLPTRVRDVDISSNQQMNQLRQILGGAGAEVITCGEFTLNRLTDQEAIALSGNLGKLQPSRIVHFINPNWGAIEHPTTGDPIALNAKTAEEWKVHLPNDTFVELGTYRVVE